MKAPEQTQQQFQEEKRKRKGKRYLFNRLAMFANHVAVVLLLLSYLAAKVSPENFWYIAFLGLGYPILVVVNLLFVVYWAIQLKKRAIYSLLVVLSGWSILFRFVQLPFSSTEEIPKKAVKVMSYNVKSFDLYNWTKNKETRNKMFNLIKDQKVDIACFQEYFHRDSSEFSNTDSLKKLIGWPYAQVTFSVTVKKVQHWGIATFSNYPILRSSQVDLGNSGNNICIYSDILIGKDTIRVYNMHLQSIAFSKEDYKYAEDLSNNVETEDIEHSKNILRRLKRAFIKRAQQADLIASSIQHSPYPVIVCGDFNDTPSSYAYSTIKGELNDAFIETGTGSGKSYIGIFPSFRIDYILYTASLKAYGFETIHEELSDHYPVTCLIDTGH